MNVIEADGLRKRYGDTEALAGLDLTVPAGTVSAVLGPNGAGKTTLVRVLTTLTRPDAGTARVAGHDVRREPGRVRARIGLVGQATAVDEVLGGRENLVLFGRLHHLSPARARARAEELLTRFALTGAADRPVATYSGGMRRRLDLAAALILDPPVLFLDEPTTGLDPRARATVHEAVRALVAAGTTVLLTTQYLEEADRLADTVAIVDHGRVVAAGPPHRLRADLGADRVEVVCDQVADLARVADTLRAAVAGPPRVDPEALRVSVPAADRVATLATVLAALTDAGLTAADVTLRRPTLDEVFLHLTDRAQVAA
ncbi:ATP-binding cassette domain-containing protein [Micromonospora sp. PLK6-60]|uniref:ATP-binding cassette domain-containing protein n=1 Tax=Micromonospora sp. PLK6-60 TaxID=2873383 RepID=UPI001CA64F51|nr:ATP-binding cassette domain-containing protein [Micromonospora sp. PLK6-60]MBY8874995.1 ATP-binding cassette domain-containing protein [Micromonospora sp. PLK6-60]